MEKVLPRKHFAVEILFLVAQCAEEVPVVTQFIKAIIMKSIAARGMLFRALFDIDSVGSARACSVFSAFTSALAVFVSYHLAWELFLCPYADTEKLPDLL